MIDHTDKYMYKTRYLRLGYYYEINNYTLVYNRLLINVILNFDWSVAGYYITK